MSRNRDPVNLLLVSIRYCDPWWLWDCESCTLLHWVLSPTILPTVQEGDWGREALTKPLVTWWDQHSIFLSFTHYGHLLPRFLEESERNPSGSKNQVSLRKHKKEKSTWVGDGGCHRRSPGWEATEGEDIGARGLWSDHGCAVFMEKCVHILCPLPLNRSCCAPLAPLGSMRVSSRLTPSMCQFSDRIMIFLLRPKQSTQSLWPADYLKLCSNHTHYFIKYFDDSRRCCAPAAIPWHEYVFT